MSESLPGRIFISYRRQETAWPAGRLYDVLVEHFAAEQVFKDVDNIEPGEDFVERITAAVASCDVLLALIGPQWLTITDENGQRRLDNPEDYVRLEIEAALKRKIRVIPILVDDAPMPRANQLPASLAALVRRNAVEINPLTFDTKRLMTTVHKTLAELKVPDTSRRSESPTSTPRSDRSNQQVAEPEVEQLYDQALAAFWTERWDQAVDLLGQVLSRQPDYADAARKLELARRQQELASHYAQASAAADAGDWEQAVAAYTMVADIDAGYRDTNARLANARHQQQLASLLAEAHRLHRAGQWAAVIKVGEQLQAIDPAAADPDGLITSARAELAAEQRAAKLAADYHTGLHLFDAGLWKEAVEALERVTRLDSTYQDAPALLDRARQQLGQAVAALAEEQTQREAEEQAADAELVPLDLAGSDPDGLATKARAERLEAELAASYARGVEQLQAGQWIVAEATFALLLRRQAGYRDAQTLLALARRRGRPEGSRYPPTAHDNPAAIPTSAANAPEQRTIGVQQSRRQREQAKQRHTPSIPPAAAATSAGDQPRPDQNKSPDKKSGRLSRGARIFLGVLTGVLVIGLALIVMIIVFGSKEILFEDFSSRVNGWDDAGSTRAGGHYTNGAYRVYAEPTGEDHVEVGAPRDASSVYPSAPLNLEIDVDVKALALPERNTVYGIACRYGENSNRRYGYAFNVGPDYVLIAKYGADGNYRGIDSRQLPAGFNVNGTNSLRAECNNDEGNQAVHLVFYVNGSLAAEGTDSDNPLPAGTVAVFAAAFKNAKKAVEAEFDGFSVWS